MGRRKGIKKGEREGVTFIEFYKGKIINTSYVKKLG